MDLNNFPTSPAAIDMLSQVSPIYDQSYVGKWIYQIMGLYYDKILKLVKGLRDELNPETCTWTLYIWAEEYDVDTDQPDDDIRAEILAKRGRGYPMNPARIQQICEKLTGRVCEITELSGTGVFKIHIKPGENSFSWKKLVEGLDKRKQAHLSYEFGLDYEGRLALGQAINIKESKKIIPDETRYTPYDPLDRVDWLSDEMAQNLLDELGNYLL